MRLLLLLLAGVGLDAEPLRWSDFPAAVRKVFEGAGLTEIAYPGWQENRKKSLRSRLDEGSAEHIAYFLLQSRILTTEPPLEPALEARRYLDSMAVEQRRAFLAGARGGVPLPASVRRRMDAFWRGEPVAVRHRILREMAASLGWPPERIVESAFRFLMRRSEEEDADGLYQRRGLSADPYPASMRAVERGLSKIPGPFGAVLLVGPGAELGSRLLVDDSLPVASPQPAALLAQLGSRPARFDCIDVRAEVVASLAGGACRGMSMDLAGDALPAGAYDLAVATNVFVYLSDEELGVALANIAAALRSGGCLLHNDPRFAARLFGEVAGIPVQHFEAITVGRRGGREQVDRVVVHCRTVANPD